MVVDVGAARPEIMAAFAAFQQHVGATGEFLTAQQRVAIATECRRVFHDAAFDPEAPFDSASVVAGPGCECLPHALVRLVHQICTKPGEIDQAFYDSIVADVQPLDYVECVAVVTQTIAQDTWHLALGLAPLPLPEQSTASAAPAARVVSNPKARPHIAMVPTVAPEDADGALAELWTDEFYSQGAGPAHVQQALSALPTEMMQFAKIFNALYIPQAKVSADPTWHWPGSIDRQQIELIATRVSNNNQCFY